MFEKVNPEHPDKVADRIAGAIVDLAYSKDKLPKIAVEVLAGHGKVFIIVESSVNVTDEEVEKIVQRITRCEDIEVELVLVPQDANLAKNQEKEIRCGDNGIFKGVPMSDNEKELSDIASRLYSKYPYDGKYIIDDGFLTICQSHIDEEEEKSIIEEFKDKKTNVNPLGYWTGGIDVDTGATNRKLGSDMGRAVTGGGLHGKDLSKADVSVNIYCHLKAQELGKEVLAKCSIGDSEVEFEDGKKIPYSEIVKYSGEYIDSVGGFEKFAEWGLI